MSQPVDSDSAVYDVRGAIARGARKGMTGSWELIKVIAPVSVAVTALGHTPLLASLSAAFEPFMRWLGLSGEAAVVLVAGNALGLYSAIGAMASLDFSPKELLILALMLSFSHNLLVETAVTRRLGVSYWGVMAYRVGLAIVAAIIVNAAFGIVGATASPQASTPMPALAQAQIENNRLAEGMTATESDRSLLAAAVGWVAAVVVDAADSLMRTIVLLIVIIIPLMAMIEVLKVTGVLERLSSRIEPYMGRLGMSGKAGFPLLAGFVFGLAYGAGVILEAAKDNDLTQGDRRLLCVFLVACHAAIEDTVLFIPLGVNPFVLLGIRILLALFLTAAAARAGIGTRRPREAPV